MANYLIRRILYAVPIIFGVMVITFLLFYVVQTPQKMAKRILGEKASQQAIQTWLHNRGYDKPRFFNTSTGANLLDSQFFHHLKSLAVFELGVSDATGEPVLEMFKRGALPSLCITLPALVCGLIASVGLALFLVSVRDSFVDRVGVVASVMLISIPYLAYMMIGQWLLAKQLLWFPAFGFNPSGFSTARFLILPVVISVLAGLGAEVRLYRAIFLDEINQDYVRTAEAKGVSNWRILFTHVLKNGMISLITLVVSSLPFLIMGSIILENFFGIPGLGNMALNAIHSSDFAVVRAEVYLGALLYLFGLLLTDICYAIADPRIRLQ